MIFHFLHRDAGVSVEWLADKEINKIRPIESVLSSAITLLNLCEFKESRPFNYDDSVEWLIKSVDNFLWGFSYYKAMALKYTIVTGVEYRSWEFAWFVSQHIKDFPQNTFIEPILNFPADCLGDNIYDSSKLFYKKVICPHYRRVKKPWWMLRE